MSADRSQWVLVDTCIWSSFFTKPGSPEQHRVDRLLERAGKSSSASMRRAWMADGGIPLPIEGAGGQRVKLHQSENLVDWKGWQTMTLGGNATDCGLIDNTAAARQRFYRVVEARPTLTDEP